MGKKGGLNFNDESIADIFNYNNPFKQTTKAEPTTEPQTAKAVSKMEAPKQELKRSENEARNKTQNTTTKGLQSGTTRTTLQIATDHLETIEALATFTHNSKIDILTQLLNRAIEELDKAQPQLLKQALKQHREIKKQLF